LRLCGPSDTVERFVQLSLKDWQQVSVTVEGDGDTAMSHPLHDRPRMSALSDQESDISVPKIMEPERLRKARFKHSPFEVTGVEVAVANRAAFRGREHEVFWSLAGHEPQQVVTEEPWDRNAATLVRFCRAENKSVASNLAHRLCHLDLGVKEIEAANTQCFHLSCPQARVSTEADEQAEIRELSTPVRSCTVSTTTWRWVSDCMSQLLDLLCAQKVHLLSCRSRDLYAITRIKRQGTSTDRNSKNLTQDISGGANRARSRSGLGHLS
jgi:hypothetical protein